MIILGIETSCDETAVSLVMAEGGLESPAFSVLGNALYSQVTVHKDYGGVYPMLAKREHGKNLTPLLKKALEEANFLKNKEIRTKNEKQEDPNSLFFILNSILAKEEGLAEQLIPFLETYDKPPIDMITVTSGPGLEPALWVGISFAKALSLAWNIPLVPTNHMLGHIASVLLDASNISEQSTINSEQPTGKQIQFPALALLISGGHTEIVHIEKWGSYAILGQTRDDAVGEAFDKVARMLDLPYPGGPAISVLADMAIKQPGLDSSIKLPRPMIHSDNLDFSFSGLKTAVLYTIRDLNTPLTQDTKANIAREFENAVVDVLVAKTEKAILESNTQSLIVAGGVIANKKIREAFTELMGKKYPYISLHIPRQNLATDNAVMIAMASYIKILSNPSLLDKKIKFEDIKAEGNLKLS